MDSKKLKIALMKLGANNNDSKVGSNTRRLVKLPKNLIIKKGNIRIFYNTNKISNSINRICSQKKLNCNVSSPDKVLNLSSDFFPNDNNINDSDLLKEKIIKTKEMYNEQNAELYKLRLKYNRLYKFHEDNLKILQNIINKTGINVNINELNNEELTNLTNKCDFSDVITNEEKDNLKEKHLISCYKAKILEYQYLLDRKCKEISKIKHSSRISRMTKLENDNACKSLENLNLNNEKKFLSEKILNMENVMDSLSDRCQQLSKNENKNMNNINELHIKIKSLKEEINIKEKIIEKLNKTISKYKDENKSLENKIKILEQEISNFQEEKKLTENFINQKNQYQINNENMKQKIEILKNENDKLNLNNNLFKKENNNLLIKLDSIQKEKDKYLLNKGDIKAKGKEKEKQIKLLDEKYKSKENKGLEIMAKMQSSKKTETKNDLNQKIVLYKEKEQIYTDKIDLLKQKIQKLEEKINLYNKLMF